MWLQLRTQRREELLRETTPKCGLEGGSAKPRRLLSAHPDGPGSSEPYDGNSGDASVGEKLFFRRLLASSIRYGTETFTGAILGFGSK